MPADWIAEKFTDAERTNYCNNHALGDVPSTLLEFDSFYDARREALRGRIVGLLAAESGESE